MPNVIVLRKQKLLSIIRKIMRSICLRASLKAQSLLRRSTFSVRSYHAAEKVDIQQHKGQNVRSSEGATTD